MSTFAPLGQRDLMNNKVKALTAVPIQERVARCLVEEVQRNNTLTSSFRLIPTDVVQTEDQERLWQDLASRIRFLLENQKKRRYDFYHIELRQIENTVGLTPAIKTRLEIILTVTRR